MSSQRFPSLDPDEFLGRRKPPAYRSKAAHTPHMNRLLMWMLLLCGASAVAMLSANRYLLSVHVLDSPISPHLDVPPLDIRAHVADERLLRLVVDECLKSEDSVIWVDTAGEMVVQESNWVGKQCPPLDIMLPGGDRTLKACTDAALHVIHAAGRIIPMQDKQQYDSYCGSATARLFVDRIYESFITLRPDVLHILLVNPAKIYSQDSKLHKHMNVFLCKTRFCRGLMKKHVARMGWRSHVWLVGHTSSDPSVDLPPPTEADKGPLGPSFLHIHGSQLQQTQQLLHCWRSQPDFPKLTVVGNFTWQDVKDSLDALNIELYPPVTEADGGTLKQPLSFTYIRQLQVTTPIHLHTSTAEAPLHAINEARASGALIVAVHHPPMSELIDASDGYLVAPEQLMNYDGQVLGQYAPLHAAIGSARLCNAVEDVLGFPQQEIYSRGRQARQAYLYDKAVFMARMQDLRAFLQQRSQGVYTMDHRVGLWQHGSVLLQRYASRGTSKAVLHDLCHDAVGSTAVECIQSAMLE